MEHRIKIHVIAEELAKSDGLPWVMRYGKVCIQAKKLLIYTRCEAVFTGKTKQPRAFFSTKGSIRKVKEGVYAII
jgi:hypothetical protein